MPGRTLNAYRLERLLGQGGMGAVYEAIDTHTGAWVAIKLLHPMKPTQAEACLRRFRLEAEVAQTIESPHIAPVLDTGTDPETGAPFMVMERLIGEDLHRLLSRLGPLLPEVVLRMGAQVCRGLVRAHAAGVIHRDIKPANLFVAQEEGGRVVMKILDFGIAKTKAVHDPRLPAHRPSNAGCLLGSLHYMSPEQARCESDLDERSDLWSLGVVLYRALTGHLPHEEVQGLGALALAVCSELPRPIQELAPWVPTEVAALVHAALQPDADNRFPSAAAMLAAIEALLPSGEELHASMFVPLAEAERAPVSSPLESLTTELPRSSRRLLEEAPTLLQRAQRLSSIPPPGTDRSAVLPPMPSRQTFRPPVMREISANP